MEFVTCECGSTYRSSFVKSHQRGQRHTNFINNTPQPPPPDTFQEIIKLFPAIQSCSSVTVVQKYAKIVKKVTRKPSIMFATSILQLYIILSTVRETHVNMRIQSIQVLIVVQQKWQACSLVFTYFCAGFCQALLCNSQWVMAITCKLSRTAVRFHPVTAGGLPRTARHGFSEVLGCLQGFLKVTAWFIKCQGLLCNLTQSC